MVAILRHHRVDHYPAPDHTLAHNPPRHLRPHLVDPYPVADQTLVDDPRGQRRRDYTALRAELAGALLALGHQHEVLGRLHIQLLALLIADDCRLPATSPARALLRRAGNHS